MCAHCLLSQRYYYTEGRNMSSAALESSWNIMAQGVAQEESEVETGECSV
jgi:hypothetical protein